MKLLAAALAFLIGLGLPAFGQTKFAPMRYMNLPQLRPWTGDFDGMLKRRSVRILVPYSKSLFFVSSRPTARRRGRTRRAARPMAQRQVQDPGGAHQCLVHSRSQRRPAQRLERRAGRHRRRQSHHYARTPRRSRFHRALEVQGRRDRRDRTGRSARPHNRGSGRTRSLRASEQRLCRTPARAQRELRRQGFEAHHVQTGGRQSRGRRHPRDGERRAAAARCGRRLQGDFVGVGLPLARPPSRSRRQLRRLDRLGDPQGQSSPQERTGRLRQSTSVWHGFRKRHPTPLLRRRPNRSEPVFRRGHEAIPCVGRHFQEFKARLTASIGGC